MKRRMKVTLLGSCRLLCVKDYFSCTDIDDNTTYVHSTKEIIQLINFITHRIEIPTHINRHCFRAGILKQKEILHSEELEKQYRDTDLFVVEISSMKKYCYENYYLHHLSADKRLHYYLDTPSDIISKITIEYQDKKEVEKDLAEIIKLLHPKKVLVVSHINALINKSRLYYRLRKINKSFSQAIRWFYPKDVEIIPLSMFSTKNIPLSNRAELIALLSHLTHRMDIPFLDPSTVLQKYPRDLILEEEKFGAPPGHYTEFGKKKMGELFAEKIMEIMATERAFSGRQFSQEVNWY